MRNITILITICITLINVQADSYSSKTRTDQYNGFKLVAYFPVNGNIEDMNEVDFSKMTHVIGAFIQSDISGNLKFPGWKYDPNKTSQEAEEEMLDSLIVKAKRAGTIPMIALGTTYDGWQMTKDPTARSNFISNIKAFIEEKELGGIDLDLEGWVDNASSPFYPEPYALLATELRDSLDTSLIITSAVSANEGHVENWTDDFISVLDWVNIMVYDIRVWNADNIANQSLFSDQIDAAKFWKARDLDKSQIVFGVPFYSRGWDYDNQRPYTIDVCWSPNHAADSSTWSWSKIGTFSYEKLYNMFTLSSNQDSVIVTQNDQMWTDDGWTGYKGTFNGVLYFNGQKTLEEKTQWAMDSGYGGMMIWELTGDLATENSHSLLGAMAKTLEDGTVSKKQNTNSLTQEYKTVLSITNQTMKVSVDPGYYDISFIDMQGKTVVKMRNEFISTVNHNISLQHFNLSRGQYIVNLNPKFNKTSFINRVILLN